MPRRGIGYGVLRYLSPAAATRAELAALPAAAVSFNYLGQFDQVLTAAPLFGLAGEGRGPEHSPLGRRHYMVEVTGLVVAGQLQMGWLYSERLHQRSTIERLAGRFLEALRELIVHCQSPTAGGYTPADFPVARASQRDIDKLTVRIKQASRR
jgi:non-ribosomal peptide synthase protein (TIGR01720 family)